LLIWWPRENGYAVGQYGKIALVPLLPTYSAPLNTWLEYLKLKDMGPHPLGTHASGALKSQVTRRSALALAGLLPTVLSSGSLAAQDDSYPSREIHIVCAFPAGSGADVWVRFFVEQIRPMVPKPIIVENKTGANGNIAAEYVARARPDGYTILSHSPTALAANRYLFKNQPIDIRSTLVNVATMIEFAF
jgi:tripartite tricarboxylate transporter family receptor